MNLKKAVEEIENLWNKKNKSLFILNSNSQLWHSGIIDFNNSQLELDRVIWLTKEPSKQNFYNEWARQDANYRKVQAYKLELNSNIDLKLANFEEQHFHQITSDYLSSSHTNLNKALNEFCIRNSIDGIIRADDLNEIALRAIKFKHLFLLNKITL